LSLKLDRGFPGLAGRLFGRLRRTADAIGIRAGRAVPLADGHGSKHRTQSAPIKAICTPRSGRVVTSVTVPFAALTIAIQTKAAATACEADKYYFGSWQTPAA